MMPKPEDAVPSEWQCGDVVLGLYEVRQRLTVGGMGLVYRVLHRGWNVELAVKSPRLRADRFDSPVAREARLIGFENEAEAWVRLGLHPHTVSCAYVRRLGDIPRVFAEWVDGGSLAESIDEQRLYKGGAHRALARILDIAIQMAWGLEHAHANQLIHQDVKPANVMLTRDGIAKVTDFGLARAWVAAGEVTQPSPGATLLAGYGGMTPAYCSPEQYAGDRHPELPLTRRTDVWSWALTVLAMFAGDPPTWAGQHGATALASYRETRRVSAQIPALPDPLADLLARCLAHDPQDRPQRMSALADTLVEQYADLIGEPYSRPRPEAATLRADGLCNQALSLLDLGQVQRAEQLWERALEADPHHPHTVYNRGLHRWRDGRMTDQELIAELERVRASHLDEWVDEYLLALVHLERGDPGTARELLVGAARREPDHPDIAAALAQARQQSTPSEPILLKGHTGEVVCAALSADGHVAVTGGGGRDRTVRVWDLETGCCLHTLAGHEYDVTAVAVSADGRIVASGDRSGSVWLWDTTDGTRRPTDGGHSRVIDSIVVSADGRLALTGCVDGAVHVWDIETGQRLPAGAPSGPGETHRVIGRGMPPPNPRAAPGGHWASLGTNGRLVASWHRGTGQLRVWELATGRLRYMMIDQHAPVVISGDGLGVLVERSTGTAALYALETGHELHAFRRRPQWGTVAAVSGGALLALCRHDRARTVQLWELDTGRCRLTLSGDRYTSRALTLSPDGRRALSSSSSREDATARVWELPRAGSSAPWSYSRPRTADQLAAERDAFRGALVTADQLIDTDRRAEAADVLRAARRMPGHVRDAAAIERWRQVGKVGRRTGLMAYWLVRRIPTGPSTAVALAVDGDVALCGGREGIVRMWDLTSGGCTRTLSGHTEIVRRILLTADQRRALSGSVDGTVRVWDLDSGCCRHSLEGHTGLVESIAMTPDGRRALSSGQDRTVRVFDPGTGELLRTIESDDGWVHALALSPDGRLAFSVSRLVGRRAEQVGARVWDAVTGRYLRTLGGSRREYGDAESVVISPDGRLALTDYHGEVDVWEVHTGHRRHRLAICTGPLVVSPDSRMALTGGKAGAVTVWDLGTGQPVQTLEGHRGSLSALTVSADSRFAVSAGQDRTVRAWDLLGARCLATMDGHATAPQWLGLSADGHRLVSCDESELLVWELDWDYEFPTSAEWDEGARPYLAALFARSGTEPTREELLLTLQNAGFGWLDADRADVRRGTRS